MSSTDLPPPYSVTASTRWLNASSAATDLVKCDLLHQFRRFVIEILAFTFDANFSLVNQALGQSSSTTIQTTTTILSESEHAELLRLSNLAKSVRKEMRRTWGTLDFDRRRPNEDHETLASMVVRPAIYYEVDAPYMLELISTYAAHRCEPNNRSKFSLVSQDKPYCYGFFRRLGFLGPFNLVMTIFGQTLWLHAIAIKTLAPNEEVRAVLNDAMKEYEVVELGLSKVYHYSEDNWNHIDWHHMADTIVTEEEEKRIRREKWAQERREREILRSEETRASLQPIMDMVDEIVRAVH
ncbi:uncharacterized protein N0V89_001830 [Didymosphaeria variabile]|uniref:Uncharacterized protein n=1 Tax=Didymosphaeria variabile TaxID=1932322 RepID=A0A9W8XTC6_9PLEO|nr:uncharacterized protein N0V89_001830 [Didymosphaeria variabile]KAJ4357255.1 hypothetical protein N0V89_001830 [Didymosphaeria variabile]